LKKLELQSNCRKLNFLEKSTHCDLSNSVYLARRSLLLDVYIYCRGEIYIGLKIRLIERVSSVGACYLLVVGGHCSVGAQYWCVPMMLPIKDLAHE